MESRSKQPAECQDKQDDPDGSLKREPASKEKQKHDDDNQEFHGDLDRGSGERVQIATVKDFLTVAPLALHAPQRCNV